MFYSIDTCMIYLVDDSMYFDLVIKSLSEVFLELDIPHKITKSVTLNDDENMYILCTTHEGKPLPKHFIAYNWEQLTTDKLWGASFFERLQQAQAVWDYSWNNVELLKSRGIQAIHVPLGYAKCMEFCRTDVQKDIDMVFLGSINESRKQKLADLLRSYRNKMSRLFIHNSCWGESMTRVYERSILGLNLHYYGGKTIFEVLRVLPMLANGLFVISEHGDDPWYETKYGPLVTWCENGLDLVKKSIQLLVLPVKVQSQKRLEQLEYLKTHCSFLSFVDRPDVLSSLRSSTKPKK